MSGCDLKISQVAKEALLVLMRAGSPIRAVKVKDGTDWAFASLDDRAVPSDDPDILTLNLWGWDWRPLTIDETTERLHAMLIEAGALVDWLQVFGLSNRAVLAGECGEL